MGVVARSTLRVWELRYFCIISFVRLRLEARKEIRQAAV